jgi:hypothetical protein
MVKQSPAHTIIAPPVPPKDYSNTPLHGWTNEMDSWAQITNSVVEDDILPTGMSSYNGWYAS